MENKKIQFSLFDIKHTNEQGVVEFELEPIVKLKKEILKTVEPAEIVLKTPKYELENVLNSDFDFRLELANIGGKIHEASHGYQLRSFSQPQPAAPRSSAFCLPSAEPCQKASELRSSDTHAFAKIVFLRVV